MDGSTESLEPTARAGSGSGEASNTLGRRALVGRLLPGRRTLRLRLTIWYIAVLAVSACVLALGLYYSQADALVDQVDQGLRETAETEARTSLDDFLAGTESSPDGASPEFMMRLLRGDGTLVSGVGAFEQPVVKASLEPGYARVAARGEGSDWRVYSHRVDSGGERLWLQAGRSLAATDQALARLRRNLLLGIPVALLLAGWGGLFLAGRALAPIDRMATTAERISVSDLSSRIGPQESEELGRLASAFDRMLDRLERGFQRERRFVADVSHELRTPLTALRGQIEVTLGRPRTPAEYERTLQDLQVEVERLGRLSNDLLLLARFDRGALALRLEELDLGKLLGTVSERVRPLAEARGQVVEERLQPGVWVRGDPDQLLRLFLNLLDNAVKFGREGGRIGLTSATRGDTVEVEISDDGPGVAPGELESIFDRFYRVEQSRARETGGYGLGLSIAREIARAHGGSLSVVSAVGQGSVFRARFPAADAPGVAPAAAIAPATIP